MRRNRTALGVLALAALALGAWACGGAEARTAEIRVDNMVCDTCVKTIRTALEKVDGVRDVKVDLKKKVVTVRYDAAKADVKGLEKAVSMSGYDADGLPADPKAHAALPECCRI
jgi:periplasmic mercuric ion binding protein